MVTFRELARIYPDRSVPMMAIENIKLKALGSQKALLIGVGDFPVSVEQLEESPSRTQEQLLANSEMLGLNEVINVSNAAGRSSVHAMEAKNRIFGVLPPGRLRGKRYPRWQFAAGVEGQPLRRVLLKLASLDAWSKYQFFSSTYPELGYLTPIQVLTGEVEQLGNVTDETRALLESPHEKRVRLIEELAEGFAHSP
jgi:hypothetical protein